MSRSWKWAGTSSGAVIAFSWRMYELVWTQRVIETSCVPFYSLFALSRVDPLSGPCLTHM